MHVPADGERHCLPGGLAVYPDVDRREVLGVVAQLDPSARQRGIHRIRVAFEGDGRGAGDPAGDRPAERLPDQRRVGLAVRPALLEPLDGGQPGLSVRPPVGDVLGLRGEQVVELVEGLDAVVLGLGQERLPDIPVESFLFSPPFR